MKYGFKIGNITVGEVKVEGMEVQVECSLDEVKGLWEVTKEAIELMPKATELLMDSMETAGTRYKDILRKVMETPVEFNAEEAEREHQLNLEKYRVED